MWNLNDCVGFSDSLVLQKKVKTCSEGYLGHGGEGIGGRGTLALTLKQRLNCNMEEKGMVAVCGLSEELLRRHQRSLHTTERSEQWSVMDPK